MIWHTIRKGGCSSKSVFSPPYQGCISYQLTRYYYMILVLKMCHAGEFLRVRGSKNHPGIFSNGLGGFILILILILTFILIPTHIVLILMLTLTLILIPTLITLILTLSLTYTLIYILAFILNLTSLSSSSSASHLFEL
jgi:hypothetical protein